ncbi:MAG: hypothetical protein CMJ31_12390 [Phycisphaerae bacterium]|nr:hypothetical protein [Phycisphaerae bacterium]|tara:strand:+ start:863 stop:2179 length:1317 start_codon:yes stop_codon:yes gene_type:complete
MLTVNLLDLGYGIVGAATAPLWARKARGGWRERFGHTPELGFPNTERPRVLLHGVSVGEVSALRSLVPLLTKSFDVVITSTTDTGMERARQLFADSWGVVSIVRYPLDFSKSVERFLDAVRPDAVALTELELWPHFVGGCRERGIPIGVINGRLSERSFKGYHRFRRVLRPMFADLTFAAVQNADYAHRFEAMGTPAERVVVAGSMKWDNSVGSADAARGAAIVRSMGLDPEALLVVAGSTGPTEEAIVHEAWKLAGGANEAQLIVAPRRPERFDEAARYLPGCVRRSEHRDVAAHGNDARVGLLDSIGELSDVYARATVVVVGRSFGDLYGSDPAEPIGLGKATIIGPSVSDFAEMVRSFERCDGIVRATRETLGAELRSLLEDSERRASVASAGLRCVEAERGASERHAALVHGMVNGTTPRMIASGEWRDGGGLR